VRGGEKGGADREKKKKNEKQKKSEQSFLVSANKREEGQALPLEIIIMENCLTSASGGTTTGLQKRREIVFFPKQVRRSGRTTYSDVGKKGEGREKREFWVLEKTKFCTEGGGKDFYPHKSGQPPSEKSMGPRKTRLQEKSVVLMKREKFISARTGVRLRPGSPMAREGGPDLPEKKKGAQSFRSLKGPESRLKKRSVAPTVLGREPETPPQDYREKRRESQQNLFTGETVNLCQKEREKGPYLFCYGNIQPRGNPYVSKLGKGRGEDPRLGKKKKRETGSGKKILEEKKRGGSLLTDSLRWLLHEGDSLP